MRKPKDYEVIQILDDSVLEAYNDSVKSSYSSEKAISTLSRFEKSRGQLTGSNPFMLVHLQNSGVLDETIRLATRKDLEVAVRHGLPVSGNYVDFGLALRTELDSYAPNDLLARTLVEQLEHRGIEYFSGKLIPFSALTLKEEKNSQYGLVFDLTESAKELEDLSQFKWEYIRNHGLARAYLNRIGYWTSDNYNLTNFDGVGRVVVVKSVEAGK